jgi:predicted RNase H-like HicB family nuclease
MEYTIRIKKNEDGWLSGQCEQLPQAISQGKDLDELMENMKDAIETVLDYQCELFRKMDKSNNSTVIPLTIKHEAKHFNKASKGKSVYA